MPQQLQRKQIPRTLRSLGLSLSLHLYLTSAASIFASQLFFHTGISSHSSSFKETNDSIHTANCDGSQTPKTNVWKWKAWNPDRDAVKMLWNCWKKRLRNKWRSMESKNVCCLTFMSAVQKNKTKKDPSSPNYTDDPALFLNQRHVTIS